MAVAAEDPLQVLWGDAPAGVLEGDSHPIRRRRAGGHPQLAPGVQKQPVGRFLGVAGLAVVVQIEAENVLLRFPFGVEAETDVEVLAVAGGPVQPELETARPG